MKISAEFTNMQNHLLVKLDGNWTEATITEAIHKIKSEADKFEQKKILIDCLELSYPDLEITRFFTGLKLAEVFSYN